MAYRSPGVRLIDTPRTTLRGIESHATPGPSFLQTRDCYAAEILSSLFQTWASAGFFRGGAQGHNVLGGFC